MFQRKQKKYSSGVNWNNLILGLGTKRARYKDIQKA